MESYKQNFRKMQERQFELKYKKFLDLNGWNFQYTCRIFNDNAGIQKHYRYSST